MTTLARPTTSESSHWYDRQGNPVHTVKCTSYDGERPTTIADARKLGLLPSVTNILRVLHKPALEAWKMEQVALTVLTSPRKPGEQIDEYCKRVLHDERQHEQEAKTAADLGTRIHRALEDELSGRHAEHEMLPYIEPAWDYLNSLGDKVVGTEKVLVGEGYAGRCDLLTATKSEHCYIWDFKTTKTLPKKGAYWEHRLQLGAYHRAYGLPAYCGNIYISTTEPGKFVVCEHADTLQCWQAFAHLRDYWQIANDYRP